MVISEQIPAFLRSQRQTPLVKFWLHYGTALETQIKAAPDNGTRVEGKQNTWEDQHGNRWWTPPRIPEHADSEPSFKDYHLRWPLELHCEAIGTTGWHWKARRSLAFGFDFDAITHADGLSDTELTAVQDAVNRLPYAWLTKSSGGKGWHVWVFLDGTGFETQNHTEHAALARWLLSQMSADAGFNFATQVDVCGANMWIWHRKATVENGGYDLVKQGVTFPISRIPPNWKDHIPVVARKQNKIAISGVEDMDLFTALAQSHRVVPLDDNHHNHINTMRELGYASDWVQDHGCWNTHVHGLLKLHEKLGLIGIYQTISAGNHPQEANCSCFPREDGSWKVYRFPFGGGPPEAPTWEQDSSGNTTCWFNRIPGLKTSARASGGKEQADGKFEFNSYEEAKKACDALGITLKDEEKFKGRKTVVSDADGRVTVEVARLGADAIKQENWTSEKKGFWSAIFEPAQATVEQKQEIIDFDNLIRCVQSEDGTQLGWRVWQPQIRQWGKKTASSVKTIFQHYGLSKPEAEVMMGQAEKMPWTIVNMPFQDEYPGGRNWNPDPIQWMFEPAPRELELLHPTWDAILNRLGHDLDKELINLAWAQECGIHSGGDYLRVYYSIMLRFPHRRLPYLFFFGDENCGKSTFHESFKLLLKGGRGVVMADRALTNQSDFNPELEHALLAVIEEKDISQTPGAAAKIKAWVTAPSVSIRKMRTDTFEVQSLNHFVQCGNKLSNCLVPPGDTRIVVIYVNPLSKQDEIGKDTLLDRLRQEASAFMRTLIDMPLPHVEERLGLPVVYTRHKWLAEEFNRDLLSQFIRDKCHKVSGATIELAEFFAAFREYIPPEEQWAWPRSKIQRNLPHGHPAGTIDNIKCVANLSWSETTKPSLPLIFINGRLEPDGSQTNL